MGVLDRRGEVAAHPRKGHEEESNTFFARLLRERHEQGNRHPEARFADPDHAATVAKTFFQGCLQEGTTTVVAYGSSHPEAAELAFQAAEAAGLRAVLGPALMDRHAPEALLRPAEDGLRTIANLRGGL